MIDRVGVGVADLARSMAFDTGAPAAGARRSVAPGMRAQYHPGYCGAFVRDPDGHTIEAVCHRPG